MSASTTHMVLVFYDQPSGDPQLDSVVAQDLASRLQACLGAHLAWCRSRHVPQAQRPTEAVVVSPLSSGRHRLHWRARPYGHSSDPIMEISDENTLP